MKRLIFLASHGSSYPHYSQVLCSSSIAIVIKDGLGSMNSIQHLGEDRLEADLILLVDRNIDENMEWLVRSLVGKLRLSSCYWSGSSNFKPLE